MKLRQLLQEMKGVQEKIGSSEPYICGGTPRDRFMKRLDNISDLDITTGDKTVQYLAQEFGAVLSEKYNVTTRMHDDGHGSVYIGSFKMDFSSNFNVPNIEKYLAEKAIKSPTDMQKEMFSRDFTCNALLLSIDLKDVIDPTHRGFKDIQDKTIRTCLSPEVTLTSNKNRVIRAIYLASKLDFDIDPAIVQFVAKNPETVKISTEKALSEKLNEAFNKDADRAVFYLQKMNLWPYIPITDVVKPYYIKMQQGLMTNKKAYFQGGGGVNEPTPKKKKYKSDKAIVVQPRFEEPLYRNYDVYDVDGKHGPGAGWHALQNYKSVSDFLKDKRKKMRDKYKADDSWIEDDGSRTKNPNMKARALLLSKITKNGTDFPNDQYIDPGLAVGESNNLMDILNPIGGQLDKYLPQDDLEGKPPTALNFGRDYVDEEKSGSKLEHIEQLLNQYLSEGLFGMPDGVNLPDEENGDNSDINPEYGSVGPHSLIYEDKWNI